MANYEWLFAVAVGGGFMVVFTCLVVLQINKKLAIILAAVGLTIFTSVVVLQMDRLKAKQWTLWDVIIVAAICFVVIWIIPDIRDIVGQWRRRNQDKKNI
jgi:hypothetical protein